MELLENDVGCLEPYEFALASVLGDAEPCRVEEKIGHRHESSEREDGELSLFRPSPGWLDAERGLLLSASDVFHEEHVECAPGTLVASLQLYVRFEETIRLLEHLDGFSKQKARCSKSQVNLWLAIVGC